MAAIIQVLSWNIALSLPASCLIILFRHFRHRFVGRSHGRFLVLGSSHTDDSYFSRRLSEVAKNLKAFPAPRCVYILTTTLASHVRRAASFTWYHDSCNFLSRAAIQWLKISIWLRFYLKFIRCICQQIGLSLRISTAV